MRSSRTRLAVFAAILCSSFLLRAQEPVPPPEPRKITVVAKKYEFNPSQVELKAGEPVEITFTSEDTKHGFACTQLNLDEVVFDKDTPATVKFTPEKPGTYAFRCTHFCGFGHGKMKGEIVVVAP